MRVVFDLDSCLTDTRHRRELCPTVNPDSTWAAFEDACAADAPIGGTVALAQILARSARLYVLTWRPERLRAVTEGWLTGHGVPHWRLLMRTEADTEQFGQDSTAFKVAQIARMLGRGMPPDLVVEDWPEVVLAVERLGVAVLCVNPLYRERSVAEGLAELVLAGEVVRRD